MTDATPPKSKRGGARAGAGRKRGVVSKAKQSLAECAREYAHDMLKVLVDLARDVTQPAAARVSAAVHIIERGHGKATAPVEHDVTDALADMIKAAQGTAFPISTDKRCGK